MIFLAFKYCKTKTSITSEKVKILKTFKRFYPGHIHKILPLLKSKTPPGPSTPPIPPTPKVSEVADDNSNATLLRQNVKEVKEVPYTVMTDNLPNTDGKSTWEEKTPKISWRDFIQNGFHSIKTTIDNKIKKTIFSKNSSDNSIENTVESTSTSTNASANLVLVDNSKEIINKLLKEGLIKHENTEEGGESSGGLIFTKAGLDLYLKFLYKKPVLTIDSIFPPLPNNEQVVYELCLWRVNKDTAVMLDGRHVHLIICYNSVLNKKIAIGYLTSEITGFLLANTQELSGNINKIQFMQPFSSPIIFDNFDTENIAQLGGKTKAELDNYIQDPNKIKALDKLRTAVENYTPKLYNGNGVTTEVLLKMLEDKKLQKLKEQEEQVLADARYKRLNTDQLNALNHKIKRVILMEHLKKSSLSKEEEDTIRKEQILKDYRDFEIKRQNDKVKALKKI